MKNKIAIVGCGNIGSILSYSLLLKYGSLISELILIDPDMLKLKNYPLGPLITKSVFNEYENYPKTLALLYTLKDFISIKQLKTNIVPITDLFENSINKLDLKNTTLIDCRDTYTSSILFKLKIALDGQCGRVVINPLDTEFEPSSDYTIERNPFYANKLANDIVYRFDNILKIKTNKEYIINYDKGDEWNELNR